MASIASTDALVSALLPNGQAEDPAAAEARESWKILSDNAETPISSLQCLWEHPILEKRSVALLDSAATPKDRARILAVTQPESGAWLNALPSPTLGTLLDNDSVRISVGLRLGINLCHPHTCRCGAQVDQRGSHGLSCQKSAGRFSRHSAINDILKRACASVHVPASLEPTGLFRTDGKRPDGLTLIPWSRGKCLLWDATCVDTLAKTHLPLTSQLAGAAAASAEQKKHRKYAGVSNLYTFCPVAVETLGPMGQEAHQLIKELGGRLRAETGELRSTSFLYQRISIAIQRGNAASVMATIPPSVKFVEIFDL